MICDELYICMSCSSSNHSKLEHLALLLPLGKTPKKDGSRPVACLFSFCWIWTNMACFQGPWLDCEPLAYLHLRFKHISGLLMTLFAALGLRRNFAHTTMFHVWFIVPCT